MPDAPNPAGVYAALRERGIGNPEDLIEIAGAGVGEERIKEFDRERQGGRDIGPGVLAKALRTGGSIGRTEPAGKPSAADERARAIRDRSRWEPVFAELPEWVEIPKLRAARELEAAGEPVTTQALKLRMGPPDLHDENDPVTAADQAAPSRLRAAA